MTKIRKSFWKAILTAVLCLSILGVTTMSTIGATIEIGTINPVIILDKANMEQAVAGSEFTLSLVVRNISSNPGFNLTPTFKIQDTDSLDPFTLKENQSITIKKLEANETRTLMLTFAVKPEAQNKDYKMLVMLEGQNAQFKNTVNVSTVINIPVTYDLTKPLLIVQSASVSPENPDVIEGFDVHLNIANLSKTTDARNISLLFDGQENFEILELSNKKNIVKLPRDDFRTITYRLRAKDTRAANTVKLTMSFDYLGGSSTSVEEVLNLPLPTQNTAVGATPWVIVNKYTLSAERILAGSTVTLKLFMENTNQRPVKNVKISLGIIKIEDSQSPTGVSTGGTVFSPINSSNSFYIDYIPGQTVMEKSIDLYVDPNAAAKTYIVPVEITYEDMKGKTLECDEMVNIPVTQECKLQVLSVQVPPVGFLGQPIPIFAEYVNVGKVALGNFMVSLEGDYEKENGTYFVGNLDIGINDIFQGSVIPEQEGLLEGTLVFSFIDNNNQDVREEHPFTIDIQAPPAAPPGSEGEIRGPGGPIKPGMTGALPHGAGSGGNTWLSYLLGGVIILEAFYIWRIKRKKASEEFFDE